MTALRATGPDAARRRLLGAGVALAAASLLPAPARALAGADTRAASLLAVARTLFPHAFLADAVYREAVARLEAATTSDGTAAAALAEGLARLPAAFAGLDTAAREAALAPLVGSPFFKLARKATAGAVYQSPVTWQQLGYPGPSAPFGGYVERPLVDLDWLEQRA